MSFSHFLDLNSVVLHVVMDPSSQQSGNMEEVKIFDPSILPQCLDQIGNALGGIVLLLV